MRSIEFLPRMGQNTKARIAAIIWATNRRGGHPWKGQNVPDDIVKYLRRQGLQMDPDGLRYAFRWLKENNYADWEEYGKRIIKFWFMPDVDLRWEDGTADLDRIRVEKEPVKVYVPPNNSVAEELVRDKEVRKFVDPDGTWDVPLPGTPPPPYKWDEFTDKLRAWAEQDPDRWADYVDSAIERL